MNKTWKGSHSFSHFLVNQKWGNTSSALLMGRLLSLALGLMSLQYLLSAPFGLITADHVEP